MSIRHTSTFLCCEGSGPFNAYLVVSRRWAGCWSFCKAWAVDYTTSHRNNRVKSRIMSNKLTWKYSEVAYFSDGYGMCARYCFGFAVNVFISAAIISWTCLASSGWSYSYHTTNHFNYHHPIHPTSILHDPERPDCRTRILAGDPCRRVLFCSNLCELERLLRSKLNICYYVFL